MRAGRNPFLRAYAFLVYGVLFAPIVVLILFSFNDSRRNFAWRGFTLKWYPELFGDSEVLDALFVTLQVAVISVAVPVVPKAVETAGGVRSPAGLSPAPRRRRGRSPRSAVAGSG